MNTSTAPTMVSAIGRAIELLRAGHRLPVSLTAALRYQGYDIPGLHSAYLNKKA